MINYESVKIENINSESVKIENINFAAQGVEEIYQNLKVLYTTPEGSVPFDRNFGINTDFLDEPIPIAQGRLMVEYRRKTKRYEPRASVEEVTFEHDSATGRLYPKVVITNGIEA
jgi:phage baseplate assembly protein W